MQHPAEAQSPQPPDITVMTPQGPVRITRSGATSPSAIFEGFRHQRDELSSQLHRLEEQREELASQLRQPLLSGADKTGLEQRLSQLDARIVEVEKQLAQADAAVASAIAVPGAVVPEPPRIDRGPPEEFWILMGMLVFVVVLPLTIAYARRIWRRGAAMATSLPRDIYDRFNRLDQAVDSVAIEVERIGEGQRFLTRAFAEQVQRSVGPGGGGEEKLEVGERK